MRYYLFKIYEKMNQFMDWNKYKIQVPPAICKERIKINKNIDFLYFFIFWQRCWQTLNLQHVIWYIFIQRYDQWKLTWSRKSGYKLTAYSYSLWKGRASFVEFCQHTRIRKVVFANILYLMEAWFRQINSEISSTQLYLATTYKNDYQGCTNTFHFITNFSRVCG